MDESTPHRSVKNLIESLLFLSDEPLTIQSLKASLPYTTEEIAAALDALSQQYNENDRGIKLRQVLNGWQLTTDPALADQIEAFFNTQRRRRLSKSSLETLAVIAYNQPITRAEIEAIRGVQTSGTLQTLLEANLIKVIGQRDTIGNPYLYGTTDEFLVLFGLNDASDLPPLEFDRDIQPVSSSERSAKENEVATVEFEAESESVETVHHVHKKGA